MKRSTTIAVAAAMGAGMFAGAASAQDMREFDQTRLHQATNEDAVRVRFTLPFGQTDRNREDPRVSFGFSRDFGGGQVGQLDMFSFSLTGDTPRLETPFALNAAGDGAWYESPRNWLLIGAGVGVAWAVYDHNQDDDDPPQNNNS